MADFMQTGDFQFILRVLNTNVDGRESEDKALLPLQAVESPPCGIPLPGGRWRLGWAHGGLGWFHELESGRMDCLG